MDILLNMILLKSEKLNRRAFSNLYFSYDDLSFVGFNEELIKCLKKYDEYEIVEERINAIGERHHEYKYIVKTIDGLYFFRYLTDDLNLIYDVLIYNARDLEKIKRIFFPNEDSLPDELKKLNKPILKIDDHVNLVFNHGLFTKYLGYEDWDYKNKCLNQLDFSCNDKLILSYFKNESFETKLSFIKNDGNNISLKLNFIYKDGYYIIDKMEIC